MKDQQPLPDFESYQKLTPEQKDYHVYRALWEIQDAIKILNEKTETKADKWVETVARGMIAIILSTVLLGLLSLVIIE